MANARTAFQDGFRFGQDWVGPNGDGSFGSLSMEFIDREYASHFGEYSGDWWDGFYKSRRSPAGSAA